MNWREITKNILNFLDELYSFQGKIGRIFYITRFLTLILIFFSSFLLQEILPNILSSLLLIVIMLLHFYGLYGLQVRRMRDLGWSPFWVLLWPVLAPIFMILFISLPSKKEEK